MVNRRPRRQRFNLTDTGNAQRLARRGCNLVLAGRNREELDAMASDLLADGIRRFANDQLALEALLQEEGVI